MRHYCLLGLFAAILSTAACSREDRAQFIPPEDTYDVRILRDNWGVPHIFGKTDADCAYGLGFAHCEDDWVHFEEAMLVVRGKYASVKGQEGAPFDFLVNLFRVREFVDEKYETEISEDVRRVVEAYADGITHYAALHPEKMPHIELPITGRDIVAGATFKSPFFYEMQHELQALFAGEGVPISRKGIVAQADFERMFGKRGQIGSNAWAVAPERSADGATRLAINSHMPWTGQVTWYEAHVHSEEGWNMIGGTFPGGPIIFKGHDDVKGWCHTINRPDLIDIYTLEINPDNEYQYKFDGEWRDFERATAEIEVKLLGPFSWTFNRDLLYSVHGPCVVTERGVYALRFVGYGEVGQLEQWYRMNKARSLDEFLAAMESQKLISLNTLYADKDGVLYYAYNGKFPARAEGYDWSGHLPGADPGALWTSYHGFDVVPQILRPKSGFVQSCNNSPFQSTDGPDNPRREDYPATLGLEEWMTNRALRALALYGGDDAITREEFFDYKYDKQYEDNSAIAEYIDLLKKAEIPDDPLLQQGAVLLRDWNLRTDKDNAAAALGLLAGEAYMDAKRWGEPLADPVKSLEQACAIMMEHHGRLDLPWEEMARLRRGTVDLGLGGSPDTLRAIDIALQDDGHFIGINGDCYFLMVEWDRDGNMKSEGIHQFGSATVDEQSPHYADQAALFVREETRPTLFTEQEIRAHLKKEYRPGEGGDPWYE